MAAAEWEVIEELADVDAGWEIESEEPTIAPGVADVTARINAASAAAGQRAMTHRAPPPATAPWRDVLATVPAHIRANAAGMIAGARLRQAETEPVGLAREAIEAGLAEPPDPAAAERERAVLAEVAAERDALAVPNESTLQAGVRQGLTSIPTAVPALAVGVLTRNPLLAAETMHPIAASEAYGELRTDGVDPALAAAHADFQGAVEAGTEIIPFAQLLKRLPAGQVLLRTLAAELPGESLAQLGQGTSDHVARAQAAGQEVTPALVLEGLRESATHLPETWVATMVASTAQVGGVALINRAASAEERRIANRPPTPGADPADFVYPTDEAIGFEVVAEEPDTAAPVAPVAEQGQAEPPPQETAERVLDAGFEVVGEEVDTDPTVELPPLDEKAVVAERDTRWRALEASVLTRDLQDETPAEDVPVLRERFAQDEAVRAAVQAVAKTAGWDTVGGKRLKGPDWSPKPGDISDHAGRTKWLPRADWWRGRPGGFNERQVGEIVAKGLAGKRLGAQQQALLDYLTEIAVRSIAIQRKYADLETKDLADVGLPPTVDNAELLGLSARAAELDPEAFERIVIQFEDDDAGFLQAIKELVASHEPSDQDRPGGAEDSREAQVEAARDLFGQDVGQQAALNRRNRQLERRRGQGRAPVSVDSAPPGDIFRDTADRERAAAAAAQTDIEDESVQAMRAPGGRLAASVQRAQASRQRPQAMSAAAGTNYVPLLQGGRMQGGRSNTITLGVRGQASRTVTIPDQPIRRESAMRAIERAFGVKVFQGKPFKVRSALGFFRPKTFEVRTKAHNDLEVTAHEFFHWLDRTYPAIRALYHEPRFRDELKGVSYDESKIFEGFAEFGRLLLTQESQAAAKAPKFYDAFMAEAERAGILAKLKRAQDVMHGWYLQGSEQRALSKIGPPTRNFREWWDDQTRHLVDREIQTALDWLHSIKVVERDVRGRIMDATVSPYKAARLLAGARGIVREVLNHGTIGFNAGGDIVFTGDGLRQVFEPVAEVFDDAMAYFVGRRAMELKRQGREKLLEEDEILALVARGQTSPKRKEIEQAFDDYRDFIDRMGEFYIQTGYVSAKRWATMRELNRDYVPFNRLLEALEAKDGGKPRAGFMRLKGGTQNLRDTWENIVGSVNVHVAAALRNHAKQLLYRTIESGAAGQRFAVRVGSEQHATVVQPLRILRQMLARFHAAGPQQYFALSTVIDQAGSDPSLAEALMYWSGKYEPSAPDIDSVLVNGEPRYYQIGDPLLMDTLQLWNSPRPMNLGLRILGGFSGTLRRGITMAPDFLIPNLIRDTGNAFALSKGGQIPFLDSVRGMVKFWKHDELTHLFFANGGGFSSLLHADAAGMRRKLERLYVDNHVDYQTVLDAPAKFIDWYDEIASSFEYGTRIAEFRSMVGKGATLREAAFEGREISTDFAMVGTSELLRYITTGVAFMKARMQGLYRLEREIMEKGGKQRFNAAQAVRFGLRALLLLTIPSILLWWRNHDDPRYQALPEWLKRTHWVILTDERALLIPKPFEQGAIFATIPEQTLEYIAKHDGPKYAEALAFIVSEAFNLSPIPTAVRGPLDIARNKDFTGRPIIPESLKDVAPEEQFNPYSSDTAIRIGNALGISPIKLDYLARSYLGTLGLYALSASDALHDPAIGGGERPAGKASEWYTIRRFVRESPFRGTAQEDEFYKVLDAAREVTATFRKIQKDQRMAAVEAYLSKGENRVLYAVTSATEDIARQASEINATMRLVRFDPKLSADEKRATLDQLQLHKNRLFDLAAQHLTRAKIEELAESEAWQVEGEERLTGTGP